MGEHEIQKTGSRDFWIIPNPNPNPNPNHNPNTNLNPNPNPNPNCKKSTKL